MNDCEFIRVVTKGDEECFLLTKLRNGGQEGFDLTLCHDGNVWNGSVSEDDLDSLCSKLKIQFSKYVKETVEALSNNSDSKHSYQYELRRGKDKTEFSWKKHVPEEDITFQLGSVALKPRTDSAEMITKIYNHCIEKLQELKTRIHSLETDNQRLSQERVNALKRLEKCVVAKEELENDLYSKFTLVLNSKKEKIRQLKEQVQDGVPTHVGVKQTVEEADTNVSRMKRQRTSTRATKSENSDSGENTDEESSKPKRSRAGTQKKRESGGDDSLILDNDDDAESGPSVSKPRRQRGRQPKKQTPAKPVLPKVGSSDATPGSERKSRLRKSGSNTSNKSSENIDADDLLEDL